MPAPQDGIIYFLEVPNASYAFTFPAASRVKGSRLGVQGFLFPIPHSPFPIPHSPFPIPHSPFPIPHSPFPFFP
ncbi:hypothetical protein FDUTEX481_05662 [Tolypothrix sp. PCC 7601]|nr:hypothetical protein FDUTEX481_05662 [Tolypothrix sp. PCC 7601]